MRASIRPTLLALALLAGCATQPPQPQSMRDPAANFTAYRTFGWAPRPAPDGTDAPLALLDQNIRESISAEMKRRGYTESQDNPDLKIAYETAKADKIENNPVRVGVGVGGWGGNVGGSVGVSSPSVRNFTEGTLVIHAIETAKNAEVWQGSISGKLTKGSADASAVRYAVSTAMRDFPARNAPAQPAQQQQ
jgi:hypothetical protein